MKKQSLMGLCHQCWQLTDECTCPAREERQRLIHLARQEWRERKETRREGRRDD